MFELLAELGIMLPFWLAMIATSLCLAIAATRRSYRAAVYALTVTWVAGLFYVPYFLLQYARHQQFVEAVALGGEIDEDNVRHFREVRQAAWTFAAALTFSSAAYMLSKPRRKIAKRKSNLEYEYWKAVEGKRAKPATKSEPNSNADSGDAARDEDEPEPDRGGEPTN